MPYTMLSVEGTEFFTVRAKNKTDLSKLTDRFFAVPRRGASCYAHIEHTAQILNTLLSPAGARVVTTAVYPSIRCRYSCCPPQGRELLRRYSASILVAWMVAVPRRGASCYRMALIDAATKMCCCPPQGRELLRKERHQGKDR